MLVINHRTMISVLQDLLQICPVAKDRFAELAGDLNRLRESTRLVKDAEFNWVVRADGGYDQEIWFKCPDIRTAAFALLRAKSLRQGMAHLNNRNMVFYLDAGGKYVDDETDKNKHYWHHMDAVLSRGLDAQAQYDLDLLIGYYVWISHHLIPSPYDSCNMDYLLVSQPQFFNFQEFVFCDGMNMKLCLT